MPLTDIPEPPLFPEDGTNAPPAAPDAAPIPANPLTPLTADSLNAQVNAVPSARGVAAGFAEAGARALGSSQLRYLQQNEEPGVRLDPSSGVPPWTYFAVAEQRLKTDKEAYLKSLYGDANVRTDKEGNFLVRVPDRGGKLKDIPLKPDTMTVRDLMDIGAQTPEIAGSVIALSLGPKKVPYLAKFIGDVIKMSAGTEAAGALKDLGVRTASHLPEGLGGGTDLPIAPGEAVTERARMAVMDAVIGTFLGGIGKIGSKLITPLAKGTPIAVDAAVGREYWKARAGLDLEQTPAGATGSGFLMKVESYTSKFPGSSGIFEKLRAAQENIIRKIQNVMQGLPSEAESAAIPSAEETGQAAMGEIRGKVAPLEKGVKAAKTDVATSGTSELQSMLSDPNVNRPAVGQAVLDRAEAMRSEFKGKAEELYDKVWDHPKASQNILDVGSLGAKLDAIADDPKMVAQVEVTKTVPTGVLGPTGKPITRQVQTLEKLGKYVPSGVLARLEEITSLPAGSKISIAALKAARTDVNDAIAQGEAIPGVKSGILKRIGSALSQEIEQGISKIGDPTLKTAWKDATTYYRENVGKFEQSDIAALFKSETQAARPGPVEVVKDALSSPDKWKAYRDFFGAASPEFKGLIRAARGDLTRTSFNEVSGTIDAKEFLSRINAMAEQRPEIAKEVLGTSSLNLKLIASAMKNVEGDLPVPELQRMMDRGLFTGMKVRTLLAEQAELTRQYRSSLVRQIAEGKVNTDAFNPSEFVERLARNADPSEISHVMSLLGDRPDLQQRIRQRAVRQILDRATVPSQWASESELNADLGGRISANKLRDAVGDSTQRARYTMLLGPETMADIEALGKVTRPTDIAEKTFGAAGGIAAGNIIHSLLQADEKYLGSFVRNYILAGMYTSPLIRRYISNTRLSPKAQAAFVESFIASTPFVEALAEEFPGVAGLHAAHTVKQQGDAFAHWLFSKAGIDRQRGGAPQLESVRAQEEGAVGAIPAPPLYETK